MVDQLLITTEHGFRADGREDTTNPWTVTELSGWFERGGVRQDRTPRPWGDGNFSSPSFREAKLPAIEGRYFSRSARDQHEAMQSLEALLGNGDMTRLTVQGPNGTTWASAQLDDNPTFKVEAFGEVFAYRAVMYVPDGYRFGDENVSGSGELALHRGTADATPSFTVTAVTNMPGGYKISSPYGEFTVLQALSVGQSHRISFAEGGVVYLGGVPQRGVYGQPRRIWTIPPGVPPNNHTLTTFGGSGRLVVSVFDTY
jgi:hypothetical protein